MAPGARRGDAVVADVSVPDQFAVPGRGDEEAADEADGGIDPGPELELEEAGAPGSGNGGGGGGGGCWCGMTFDPGGPVRFGPALF